MAFIPKSVSRALREEREREREREEIDQEESTTTTCVRQRTLVPVVLPPIEHGQSVDEADNESRFHRSPGLISDDVREEIILVQGVLETIFWCSPTRMHRSLGPSAPSRNLVYCKLGHSTRQS